jgi:Family of unknown function (DUF6492)
MASPRVVFITPSYDADFERCRLLCDSMDRTAREPTEHLLLVADHDVALFKPLAGPRRRIIADSELLPDWLVAVRPPLGRCRWITRSLTRPVWPMSGWHVQQLRKLLVARLVSADVLVMADSDSVFIRPFGQELFVDAMGQVRLYGLPGGIGRDEARWGEHHKWTRTAAAVLNLPEPTFPATDYIVNLVSWRRDHALALLRHVEETTGLEFVEAMGRRRTFSEYQLYGAFAENVLGGAGHFSSAQPLSHTYWAGDALTGESFARFASTMDKDQIALCIQSFTDTSTDMIRAFIEQKALA